MTTERRWLWLSYSGLIAFALFFAIRPLIGPGDAYRPRLVPGITYAYSFVVVAAFVPYVVAGWAARRGISFRRAAVAGGVLHLIVLLAPLTQSQDLYSYLFYGKMWAVHGANPYTVLPRAFASDAWFPWVQWTDQATVYGPVWTMVTGGVARIAGGSLAAGYVWMKAVVLTLGAASMFGLAAAARARGSDQGRAVLLGAWNPLMIVSLSLGGHADVAVAAAILWGLVADRRGRPLLATVLLTGAWLVKAYAAVVLLVYLLALLKRRPPLALRATAVAMGGTTLAWLPFWKGPSTLEGLAGIAGRASASLAGQLQLALGSVFGDEPATLIVRIAAAGVIGAVILMVTRRSGFAEDPWPGAAAAFLAYVAVTPWFLYWHLAGPLTLALVAGGAAVRTATMTFSGTAMLTASFGSTWWGRVLQTSIRYGIPAWAGIRAARPRKREGTRPRSPRPQGSSA
ncbi:MAG: hypothetical protein ACRDH9_05505 [Actinomycetota bacterium]